MSDDRAFEPFVREHTLTLYRTALLLTGNQFEAEELLQDTLARLGERRLFRVSPLRPARPRPPGR